MIGQYSLEFIDSRFIRTDEIVNRLVARHLTGTIIEQACIVIGRDQRQGRLRLHANLHCSTTPGRVLPPNLSQRIATTDTEHFIRTWNP